MTSAVRSEVVELLIDLDPTSPGTFPMDWMHHDGTFQTTDERDLSESATWDELTAARDLFALNLDIERST